MPCFETPRFQTGTKVTVASGHSLVLINKVMHSHNRSKSTSHEIYITILEKSKTVTTKSCHICMLQL